MPPFPFPKVSDRIRGWSCIKVLLCDHSGFGQPHEPALTYKQLKQELRELYEKNPKYGYGIIDVGDFQLQLGVFENEETNEP